MRASLLVHLALFATAVADVGAQTEIAIEAGASQVRPPLGVDGASAAFLVGGLRGSRYLASGTGVSASALMGRVTDDAAGGDFVSGSVSSLFLRPLGHGWAVGLEARAFGFDVTAPFPYRAYAVEGGPELRYTARAVSARIRGKGGVGTSRVELHRGDRVRTVEDDLWRVGGSAEVLFGAGQVMGGLAGAVHHTAGGTFTTGGIRAVWAAPMGAAELRLEVWETPLGTQATGGLGFVIPMGGWTLRGFAGRSEPDPLTLAEPGGGSGGVLLGRTLLSRNVTLRATGTLTSVLEPTDGGARVRVAVSPPGDPQSVALLGDFSGWEPLAMSLVGGEWLVDLVVPDGTHHFGFLVDGDWFVPADAPDLVPDDWGRMNATLVIER